MSVCLLVPGVCVGPHTTDINECASDSTCDQVCNNNEGSYTCSCRSGYELITDGGRDCTGELFHPCVYVCCVHVHVCVSVCV